MKKTLSLAFAMLLAVGSAVQAQDEAPPVPVDAQPSVSDSVVAPQATPVPVAATSVVSGAVASDCVGCGIYGYGRNDRCHHNRLRAISSAQGHWKK